MVNGATQCYGFANYVHYKMFNTYGSSCTYSIVEKGCNSNFLEDLKLAIEDFKAFQCEEPEKVKIPD